MHRPSTGSRPSFRVVHVFAVALGFVAMLAQAAAATGATVTVHDFSKGSFQPSPAKVTEGGIVTWSFATTNTAPHTSTDSSGMALWDSGSKVPGTSFQFTFIAAGTYPYHCSIHTEMVGTIKVALKANPATGTQTTVFHIVWSSAIPPAGYQFHVQVKGPTDSAFKDLIITSTQTKTSFTPNEGNGKYSFRSRLQNGTGASGYSTVQSISVTS